MHTHAFYPGAGTDLVPPTMFRTIKHWIYMDSQPRSEFGNKVDPGYARPIFIPSLLQTMDQNGFELQSMHNDIYTFYHPLYEQTIRYETNAVFPEDLYEQHFSCDTLVLCGYELTNPPSDFITWYAHIITDSRTVHDESEEQLLLSKSVSTLMYDPTWSYWETEHYTPPMIQRYVTITNRIITYEELHHTSNGTIVV